MLACARRRILLADHSKIGQVSTHKYGELPTSTCSSPTPGLPDDGAGRPGAAGLPTSAHDPRPWTSR